MTVSALTELFLMDMGYARNDTAEDDVVAEYAGVLRGRCAACTGARRWGVWTLCAAKRTSR